MRRHNGRPGSLAGARGAERQRAPRHMYTRVSATHPGASGKKPRGRPAMSNTGSTWKPAGGMPPPPGVAGMAAAEGEGPAAAGPAARGTAGVAAAAAAGRPGAGAGRDVPMATGGAPAVGGREGVAGKAGAAGFIPRALCGEGEARMCNEELRGGGTRCVDFLSRAQARFAARACCPRCALPRTAWKKWSASCPWRRWRSPCACRAVEATEEGGDGAAAAYLNNARRRGLRTGAAGGARCWGGRVRWRNGHLPATAGGGARTPAAALPSARLAPLPSAKPAAPAAASPRALRGAAAAA
jgi:hypothetical protein